MAANISINRANVLLNRDFGNSTSSPPPGIWYLGLSITPINKDGSGVKEPIIDTATSAPYGYKRLVIQNSMGSGGSFSNAADGRVVNSKALNFLEFEKEITVSGSTGDLYATHYFLSPSPTSTASADVAYMGELKVKRPLVIDSIVSLNAGDLIFEFDLT